MNPAIEFDVEVPIEVQQHPCLTCMHWRLAVHVYRHDGETYVELLACRSAPVADFTCAEVNTPPKGRGGRKPGRKPKTEVEGQAEAPKRRGRPPKVQPKGVA